MWWWVGGMCILEFVKCSKFCKLKDIFHFWEKKLLNCFHLSPSLLRVISSKKPRELHLRMT